MNPNESTKHAEEKIRVSVEEMREEFGRQLPGKERYVGFSEVLFPTLNVPPEELKSRVIFALDTAEHNDVPVFFHLDDEHFWFRSPDLWQNPEMAEWSAFPKPGEAHGPIVPRYWLDWGHPAHVYPAPFPCFQSPAFRAEMGQRLKCIAEPIAQRLKEWSKQGKEYLFAGVASGNETRIPDYRHGYTSYVGNPEEAEGMDVTQTPHKMVRMRKDEIVPLGYHSLYVQGYDQQSIERLARERGKNEDQIVLELLDKVAHDYAEFQAKTLNEAGLPKERIYTHFSGTSRPAQPAVTKILEIYRQPGSLPGSCNLTPPVEAAVNNYSRPGFTIVHDSVNLKALVAQLGQAHAAQEGRAWAAVESYVTTAQPGLPQTEAQYEEYLGGLLSHGAKVVNIYGWNIPLAAKSLYAVKSSSVIPVAKRWLAGAHLPDTWEQSGQAVSLRAKMAQFQKTIHEAASHGGNPGPVVESVTKELTPLLREGKFAEAEAVLDRAIAQLQGGKPRADELLALGKGDSPAQAKPEATNSEALPLTERLPPKIHRIQKELPAWIGADADKESKATALMHQLKEHLDAKNFEEAEKTADAILEMMGLRTPAAPQGSENKPQQTPSSGPPSDDPTKRLTEKVERIKRGARRWAASGRDPAEIVKTMQEKVKPLLDAGKAVEAEAELDRVLEQLQPRAQPTAPQAEQATRSKNTGRSPEQSFAQFSLDKPLTTIGDFGMQLIFTSLDSPIARIKSKLALAKKLIPEWTKRGGDGARIQSLMEQVSQYGSKHKIVQLEKTIDEVLSLLGAHYARAADESVDMHRTERNAFIANAKRFNIAGIEEYMGLSVIEPERGKANWGQYREDAGAIKKAGVKLVAYLWAQALPNWMKHDSKYVFTGNVVTGLETENLSIFAAETLDFYDHLFGEASREIGDLVDVVRIGSPYDYGECAYPAGAGSYQLPKKNVGPGFWVNEAPARAHFKAAMKNKYGTVAQLNAAWGTSFRSLETIDYPKDPKGPRYWLDFIHWYQDGFTERMGEIVAIAQKHFPKTPININYGWPFEKVTLGVDIPGLAKMAADKGLCLRTPTGPHVPFLMTKRVATAVRYYSPARFSSEPVGNSAKSEEMALAYFKDLTTGVNWHMDYTGNYERCQKSFAEFRTLWAGGEYPQIDTALFFPTTAHFLDDWDNWRSAGFGGGFPEGLQAYAEQLRDMVDYDVLDERLVSEGLLKSYRYLIWPTGKIAEAETLEKVKTWVAGGGTLLVAGFENIKTVEQKRGAFEDLAKLPATGGVRQVGKGKVIRIGDKAEDLDAVFPAALDARDGVLISSFKEGTLVFNKTGKTVVKQMSVNNVPTEITLAPLQLRWIRRPWNPSQN